MQIQERDEDIREARDEGGGGEDGGWVRGVCGGVWWWWWARGLLVMGGGTGGTAGGLGWVEEEGVEGVGCGDGGEGEEEGVCLGSCWVFGWWVSKV